jgi:hypothetical protein
MIEQKNSENFRNYLEDIILVQNENKIINRSVKKFVDIMKEDEEVSE